MGRVSEGLKGCRRWVVGTGARAEREVRRGTTGNKAAGQCRQCRREGLIGLGCHPKRVQA